MVIVDGREVLTTLEELITPKSTALLVIDMQNDVCTKGGYNDSMGLSISPIRAIVPRLKKLLQGARRVGVKILFAEVVAEAGRCTDSPAWIRFLSRKRGFPPGEFKNPPLVGTWGSETVKELAPLPGEVVIRKHRSSAFLGTNLDLLLRNAGVKTLVVTGMATEGCVESTARDAWHHDYYAVVVRDCVANLHPKVHRAALTVMTSLFDVVEFRNLLEIWAKSAG